jgi:hypothetical protein
MVNNKTATNLLYVGFGFWIAAILIYPMSAATSFILDAAAVATFLSGAVIGLALKRAEHGS